MSVPFTSLPYGQLGLKPVLLGELMGEHDGKRPWRIVTVERGVCHVIGFDDAGDIVERHASPPAHDAVVVGDWVLLDTAEGPGRVEAILRRQTWLRRGSTKREGEVQLLAANLDTVFIVAAFAETDKLQRRALNARRLDRFVMAVREGGAMPVIVLNKMDLAADDGAAMGEIAAEIRDRQGGAAVLSASATERRGLAALANYLVRGDTVAFVGMSGVGKSSLINALLDERRQAVGGVREGDAKGRHTTTQRELIVMPSGALLIDTPGIRELAVYLDGAELPGFDDITSLAADCRFGDCAHFSEPGCAVMAALESGALSAERLASYRELGHEVARADQRRSALGRHLEKKAGKRFGKMVREAKDAKKTRSRGPWR